jgi:hypothetical protein
MPRAKKSGGLRARLLPRGQRYVGVHSVRGLVDTASPLGARWIDDEACDDPFSVQAVRAQRELLKQRLVEWPGVEPIEMSVLAGRGGSPSLVWHAQAVGILLELGFLPTAKCVQEHLGILEKRLDPDFAINPEGQEQREPWLLRTRHVAWVLACLAELPLFEVTEKTLTGQTLAAALAHHKNVVVTAARYLLGVGTGPADWVARDEGDARWTEVWGKRRQPNAINTIYAALAICRAERHGFLEDVGDGHTNRLAQAIELFDNLLVRSVVVEPQPAGPEVKWNGYWNEGWITGKKDDAERRDLPDGIVGLLALALVEYSGLLQELSEPDSDEEKRALAARMLARRLGHVLVFRAKDNQDRTHHKPHWTAAADAFFSEEAEGEWYVPSYSVCLRAVLETGAVRPDHPVVLEAFETLDRFATSGASDYWTWIDPTRYPEVSEQARRGLWQHAKVDLSAVTPVRADDGSLIGENASGLHAAVMAYAGLRRAVAREDPRKLLNRDPLHPSLKPSSPFRLLEVEREATGTLTLRATAEGSESHPYRETTTLSPEALLLLETLAAQGTPIGAEDLGLAIHARAGDARHSQRAAAVSGLVGDINRWFGVRLVESDDSSDGVTYTLPARLTVHP